MFTQISKLFGGERPDIKGMLAAGAKVIDVRTPEEFRSGHYRGAVNMPLDRLRSMASSLDKNKEYVLCCRSGMRSATATSQLKSMGFTKVYNGGSWTDL